MLHCVSRKKKRKKRKKGEDSVITSSQNVLRVGPGVKSPCRVDLGRIIKSILECLKMCFRRQFDVTKFNQNVRKYNMLLLIIKLIIISVNY